MFLLKFLIFHLVLLSLNSRGDCTEEQKINYRQESPWTWICQSETCVKVVKSSQPEVGTSLDLCKLNCGKSGSLWPLPTGRYHIGKDIVPFYPENFIFETFKTNDELAKTRLKEGTSIFREYLLKMHPEYKEKGVSHFPGNSSKAKPEIQANSIRISIHVTRPTLKTVNLDNAESYQLSIHDDRKETNSVTVIIISENYFGARHGLETLSQLIAYDEEGDSLMIVSDAAVADAPVFPYRGILIDTSRNFFSIDSLKRIVDGMSYNKLNVLHWHIVDSHSFPFYSKRVPQMTKWGAYDQRKIYTIEEMKDLVEYGRIRGVKILPELDAPAHVGNGWQWGPSEGKGNLAVCVNQEPWIQYCVEPPCGQFNPINDNVYHYLGEIYKDMLEIFDNDMFHMGGDEVNINCWNSTKEITDWLKEHGRALDQKSYLDLWELFQNQAYDKLKEASENKDISPILWTSELASIKHIKEYLDPSQYIIQVWTTGTDPVIKHLVENDYRIILSNYDAWYLDCGYGAWVGSGNNWCSPYKGWQTVYENSPVKMLKSNSSTVSEFEFRDDSSTLPSEDEGETEASVKSRSLADEVMRKGLILGGEMALWSEQVDENAVDGKIWPRVSAFAERMWSNPDEGWRAAEVRMIHNRQRYVQRGIQADRLQPEYCHQNEGLCYLNQ